MATTTATAATTVIKGQTIPVAAFDTLNLEQLEKGEPGAVQRLLAASASSGWFYVDLRTSANGQAILKDVPAVYKVADDYFMQPKESKEKDARSDQKDTQDRGFKTSYCDETFEMARDEMQSGTISWPALMKPHGDMLRDFSDRCHKACQTIVARLSDAMRLPEKERFEHSHRDGVTSDSGLKLIYEPSLEKLADVGDNLHTDSGTVTFLFYDKWGLSAHSPGKGFEFPASLDGCALINIGDSLQRLSGNKLLSPKHRVTQPTDGAEKRYYLSYFLRPEEAIKESWN